MGAVQCTVGPTAQCALAAQYENEMGLRLVTKHISGRHHIPYVEQTKGRWGVLVFVVQLPLMKN